MRDYVRDVHVRVGAVVDATVRVASNLGVRLGSLLSAGPISGGDMVEHVRVAAVGPRLGFPPFLGLG